MIITCNVTGSDRKHLAQTLGEILSEKPVYLKAPTYAYQVGNYSISRDSEIICPDSATEEDMRQIVSKLESEGFAPVIEGETLCDVEATENTGIPDDTEAPAEGELSAEDEATDSAKEALTDIPAEMPDVAPESEDAAQPDGEAESPTEGAETPDVGEEPTEENLPDAMPGEMSSADSEAEDTPAEQIEGDSQEETTDDSDDTLLSISIPRSKLPDDVLGRFKSIVANKEVLFKRALLVDALPIETTDEKVSFPWFKLTGIEGEAEAYAQFISHLVKMAEEQTRVLDKPYDGDNDKFAMRIFMVRMGMKGDKFALARKLMMKHLTGNSGWRYGAPPKKKEAPTDAPAEMPDVAAPTEDNSIKQEDDTHEE